jgi:hypothetical protein
MHIVVEGSTGFVLESLGEVPFWGLSFASMEVAPIARSLFGFWDGHE